MSSSSAPAYLQLHRGGELARRVDRAAAGLRRCRLCPRACGVDRLAGDLGFCRTGARARVASFGPHFGEEAPLSGTRGSGTIFFEGCNLGCLFCQNHDISHIGRQGDAAASAVDSHDLAVVMLELQRQGCHNINLVTPSHVVPQVLAALDLAAAQGLSLPLVFNTSAYDAPATLELLRGVVDIYMPDAKFWHAATAARLCRAPDYPRVMRRAITLMHAQVGDLELDDSGLARRGLLARHLVMPGQGGETRAILRFLARCISPRTHVNLMDQYRPEGAAREHPPLDRPLEPGEFQEAREAARRAGLQRLEERDLARLLRRLMGA